MSLVRQSILAGVTAVVSTASRFAFTAILVRHLSSEEFGKFAYGQWLVDIAFLICAFGATGAASRYIAEFRNHREDLQSFIRCWIPWALGLPVFGGVVVLVGARISGYSLDNPSNFFIVLWAVANGIAAMQMAALSGLQRFDLVFQSSLIYTFITLAGLALLSIYTINLWSLYALMALASGAASVPGVGAISRLKQNHSYCLSSPQWQSIRKYAFNMWFVALLSSLVWSRGELPIVKAHLGDAGVASYVAVLTIFNGAIQGAMLGMSAVAPQLTRLWGAGQKEDALQIARNIMEYQLFVCATAASVLIYLGPEILSFIFGVQYREHSRTLAILSIGLVSIALSNQNHVLQIASNGRFSLTISLIGLFSLMGMSLVIVPSLAVEGAGIARAVTMTMMAFITAYVSIRKWGREAAALRNLVFVSSLLIGTVCMLNAWSEQTWVVRSGLLGCNIAVLSFAIRTSNGRSYFSLVTKRMQHVLFTRGAGH